MKHQDTLIYTCIFAFTFLSRLISKSQFLFNWDAVQFALATEKFQISAHQPHPPGYIFYVFIPKLIDFIVGDVNLSFIILNAIASALTACIVFLFLKKITKNYSVSIVGSIALATIPLFWFYGEIANAYVFDALFACLLGFLAYIIIKGDYTKILWLLLFWGIAGGFRPTLIVVFAPIVVFALIIVLLNKKYKLALLSVVIAIIATTAWFLPTIMLSGGIKSYIADTAALMKLSSSSTSILDGAPTSELINNIKTIVSVLFTYLFWLFIPVLFVAILGRGKFLQRNTETSIFILLWILPSFAIYTLGHLGQIGYLLTLLHPLAICFIWFMANVKAKKLLVILLLIMTFSNAYVFYKSDFIIEGLSKIFPKIASSEAVYSIKYWNNRFGHKEILSKDKFIEANINFVLANYNPEDTVIITRWGRTDDEEAKQRNEQDFDPLDFRIASYYFPEYEVYQIRSDNKPAYLHSRNHDPISKATNSFKINLNSKIKNLIFFDNGIDSNTKKDYNFMVKELIGRQSIFITQNIPAKYLGYSIGVKH